MANARVNAIVHTPMDTFAYTGENAFANALVTTPMNATVSNAAHTSGIIPASTHTAPPSPEPCLSLEEWSHMYIHMCLDNRYVHHM